MEYQMHLKENYDKSVKFNKENVLCYSKKRLDELYGKKNYQTVGEILAKEDGDSGHPYIQIHEKEYIVFRYGKKSRVLYKEAGYISVGEDKYIAILKSRVPMILLILSLLLMLSAGIWFATEHCDSDKPAHKVIEVDPNAGKIRDDKSEKKESENGGGSVSLTYSLDASLSLDTGNIEMYLLNPNASNHDISVALQIVDGENRIRIAESGLIKAGYGLTFMEFEEDSAKLSKGTYNAEFVISFYDPETNEKALVESSIKDVKLEVQ